MSTLIMSITNLDQLQHCVVARHQFDDTGGTIGSAAVTWQIDDRTQTVAPLHCEIRWIEGSFCVIDHCNRTYLNDSALSLGALTARRLLEGDQLRIGAYRLQVQLSQTDARSLEDLFSPGLRVLDQLIADFPTRAWQAEPTITQAPVEICSVFVTAPVKDPLAALDAETATGLMQENPLQRLVSGEHS